MKNLFYIIILLLPAQLFAQGNLPVLVTDQQGKPLDAATVTLSQQDKVISSRLTSEGKTLFSNLTANQYKLSVSIIGYKPLLRTFAFPKDSLKLIMAEDKQQLKEVAISFKKQLVERKPDKVIYNVENSVMASSGSAWEALSKAPGVQTTEEGNVTANNKGVTVYMDDKPIRLSGDQLVEYLRGLPADQISKIEVMPIPSSRYDAQGGAVINIVSKKTKAEGMNVSLNSGYIQGIKSGYKGNALFNYRKNNLNIFGDYGYYRRTTERTLTGYTLFQSPGQYADWERKRVTLSTNTAHNYKLGADYNLTENQVLGFLFTGNNNQGNSSGTTLTNVFNNYHLQPDSVLSTYVPNKNKSNNFSVNLNYKIKLDTAGQSLNIDLDYVPYQRKNIQEVDNKTYRPDGSLGANPFHILTPSNQKIDIWSGKVDYNYRLDKKWIMESGIKYTSIVNDNQLDYFNVAGNTQVLDPDRSNRFKYDEQTSAAYTSINRAFGKWELKAGLRLEYTRTKGYAQNLDSVNTNNYFKLFPTLYLSYNLSEDHQFNLSYNKRIERPDYRQLDPSKYYSTPYSYQSGNPFLRPAYYTSAELSYTFKKHYSTTLFYNRQENLVSNATVQDNVTKTYYDTQQNIGSINEGGISFSANFSPFSWWDMSYNIEGRLKRQKAVYLDATYDYRNQNYWLQTNQSFIIDKEGGLKAEASFWYRNLTQQGVLRIARTYDLSAGISKSILNKQGTIRFTASDILYKNPYKIDIDYNGQRSGFYQKADTRLFNLGFSYKFGKSIKEARRRATASEEERKRSN